MKPLNSIRRLLYTNNNSGLASYNSTPVKLYKYWVLNLTSSTNLSGVESCRSWVSTSIAITLSETTEEYFGNTIFKLSRGRRGNEKTIKELRQKDRYWIVTCTSCIKCCTMQGSIHLFRSCKSILFHSHSQDPIFPSPGN